MTWHHLVLMLFIIGMEGHCRPIGEGHETAVDQEHQIKNNLPCSGKFSECQIQKGNEDSSKMNIHSTQYNQLKLKNEKVDDGISKVLSKFDADLDQEKFRSRLVHWWKSNVWYSVYLSEEDETMHCHSTIQNYCTPQGSRFYFSYYEKLLSTVFIILCVLGICVIFGQLRKRTLFVFKKFVEVEGQENIWYKYVHRTYQFAHYWNYGKEYDDMMNVIDASKKLVLVLPYAVVFLPGCIIFALARCMRGWRKKTHKKKVPSYMHHTKDAYCQTDFMAYQPMNGKQTKDAYCQTNFMACQPTIGMAYQPANGMAYQPMNGLRQTAGLHLNNQTFPGTFRCLRERLETTPRNNFPSYMYHTEGAYRQTNFMAHQPMNGMAYQPMSGMAYQPMSGMAYQPMSGMAYQPMSGMLYQSMSGMVCQPINALCHTTGLPQKDQTFPGKFRSNTRKSQSKRGRTSYYDSSDSEDDETASFLSKAMKQKLTGVGVALGLCPQSRKFPETFRSSTRKSRSNQGSSSYNEFSDSEDDEDFSFLSNAMQQKLTGVGVAPGLWPQSVTFPATFRSR